MMESFHKSNFDKMLVISHLGDEGYLWTRLAPSDQLGHQEEYPNPQGL